jgi:hypothetical protein
MKTAGAGARLGNTAGLLWLVCLLVGRTTTHVDVMDSQVPGRAWAAEGIPRLASQRAAAERPGFNDAAAAAQHPASLRAQVPKINVYLYT